jgi:KTSC domain
MTPIISAIAGGHGEEEILSYMTRAFPKLVPKIQKAKNAGYSVKDILKFLSSSMQGQEYDPSLSESEARGIQRRRQDALSQDILKTAAASYAVPKIAGAIAGSQPVQDLLGKIGKKSDIGPQPMSNAPTTTTPDSLHTGQETPPTSPLQQSTPTTPTQQSPEQSISVIEQMGIGPQIQTMQAAGNSPEAIAAAVGVTMKPNQRKWLDEQIKAGTSKSLPDLITDYVGQFSSNSANNEKISPKIAQNVQKQPNSQEKTKLKAQKGELVSTPGGEVGEIKSQRNGKALVDLNGKLHQEEEKSLEMPNEELIQAVETLLNLPEIEKSAIISSLVYRPSKKEMFVKFHNGTRYVYEDVDEEDIRPIAEAMGVPVTTGQNIYGAWEKGKQDSRGAALIHGIIRNPKYAKEQEGKTWEKLETKYDRHQKLHRQAKRKRKE